MKYLVFRVICHGTDRRYKTAAAAAERGFSVATPQDFARVPRDLVTDCARIGLLRGVVWVCHTAPYTQNRMCVGDDSPLGVGFVTCTQNFLEGVGFQKPGFYATCKSLFQLFKWNKFTVKRSKTDFHTRNNTLTTFWLFNSCVHTSYAAQPI